MSHAYKCDMCDEYMEGWPALSVDIESMGVQLGGGVVLENGDIVEWSLMEPSAEFCSECSKDVIRFIDGGIRHE